MQTRTFRGPLFIVGMSRSGTKLLRDLLNQHSRIALPFEESQFIPQFVRRFGNPPSFSHPGEFYQAFAGTTFFWNMQRRGRVLPESVLIDTADMNSWALIFEVVFRFYAAPETDSSVIWGDKTPDYLQHMELLNALYPEARFLHMIRDPRDRCLSVNRTWGKHIYRAADEWRRALETARVVGRSLGDRYREVRYEDLLSHPEKVLRKICEFLGCEFTPKMLTLETSPEHLGDARGLTQILRSNQKKYLSQLSPTTIKRVEEIVCPAALAFGYELEYATQFRPLSPWMLGVLRVYDAWVALKFHVGDKGLFQGLRYFYQVRQSSH